MIEPLFDVIVNSIIPLTLVLSSLLLVRPNLLKFFGANVTYLTWLLVPLTLFCYQYLPSLFYSGTKFLVDSDVERVLITSRQTMSQINEVDWLMISSAFVSLFLVVLAVIDHWQFRRTLFAAPSHLTEQVLKYHQAFVANRRITLFVSEHVESPILLGLLSPKLILPSNFLTIYSHEQQQLIIAHEICHFDRNDIYWNLLAFAFIALFWFHPLIWLAYIRFRRDQELSCDQTTLARKPLDSRINYSRALLITAQQKQRLAFAHLSFNEYGDKTVILERITQLKSSKMMARPTFALYGVIIAALMTSVSYAGHVGQQGELGASAKQSEASHNVFPTMRIEPTYPVQAAKEGVEGAVLLKFDINAQGNTENIQVISSSPESTFDNAAITALEKWQYESKNQMLNKGFVVQLDFLMNESSKPIHLVERIKVSH
jgi:TonB family protein